MGVKVVKKEKKPVKKKSATPQQGVGTTHQSSDITLYHDAFITAIKEAIGNVTVTLPDGSTIEGSEVVAAVTAKGPMANVGMKASRTINLGDYNSLKIEVALYAPAEMNEDDINETYVFIQDWVDTKMDQIITAHTAGE